MSEEAAEKQGAARNGRPDPGVISALATSGFSGYLGMRFLEASGDRVVVEWQVREELHQPYGIVHGGAYCAAIETIASIGAALWFGDRGNVVGVNNNTDFLRAVREGRLRAVGEPQHRGRLQQLWQVDITDEDGRSVAQGRVRLQNVENAERLGH